MAISSRRHLLRLRTAGAHAALDELVGDLDSLDSYRRYLRGLHAFRVSAERALDAGLAHAPAAFARLRPTRIVESMRADMADLGSTPVTEAALVAPATPSELVGLVYVLEGSALGARLLKRQAAALGLGPQYGARHLAVQAESLDTWHGFLTVLDALDPFEDAEAVAAAEAAFASARQGFHRLDAQSEAGEPLEIRG